MAQALHVQDKVDHDLPPHVRLVDEALDLRVGRLALLVGLEQNADQLAELRPTARQRRRSVAARLQGLQDVFPGQWEGQSVASSPEAMPGHVSRFV